MSKALKAGIDEMMHVGRAQRGDRTMLDALIPAQEALEARFELLELKKNSTLEWN